MKNKLLSFILAVFMIVSMIPFTATAAETVTYIYRAWDDINKEVVENTNKASATPIKSSTTAITLKSDWYFVDGNVETTETITVSGTPTIPTRIILKDGCKFTASKGIRVADGNALVIYAQKAGTGELYAIGGNYGAGIGGKNGYSGGNITINGGSVTATGGEGGAGIGGGQEGAGGNVTINGGSVTVTGGNAGAAIGGGYQGAGGTVTVNGGTVIATGGSNAAGIGGGYQGAGATTTITGGTVEATGGDGARGISGEVAANYDVMRAGDEKPGEETELGEASVAEVLSKYVYFHNHDFSIFKYVDEVCHRAKCPVCGELDPDPSSHCDYDGDYLCDLCEYALVDRKIFDAMTVLTDYAIATNIENTAMFDTLTDAFAFLEASETLDDVDIAVEDCKKLIDATAKAETKYENYLITGHEPIANGASGLYNARSYYVDDDGAKVTLDAKVYDTDKSVTFQQWYLRTMVQYKDGGDGKLDIRFVTMLDEKLANYEKAGFIYSIAGEGSIDLPTTEGYTSFVADGKTTYISEYSQADDFFVMQNTLFSKEVVDKDPEITATPYVTLMDGTTLTGKPVSFHLSDFIKNTYKITYHVAGNIPEGKSVPAPVNYIRPGTAYTLAPSYDYVECEGPITVYIRYLNKADNTTVAETDVKENVEIGTDLFVNGTDVPGYKCVTEEQYWIVRPRAKNFIGWFTDENFENRIEEDTFVVNKDTDLYGFWDNDGEPTDTITFYYEAIN